MIGGHTDEFQQRIRTTKGSVEAARSQRREQCGYGRSREETLRPCPLSVISPQHRRTQRAQEREQSKHRHAHGKRLNLRNFGGAHEVLVVLLPLPWKPGDECGPQHEPRNPRAQLAQERLGVLPVRAVHREQDGPADVLQGDVDVLDHLRVGRNLVDEAVREVGRIRVQDADPLNARDLGQGA